MGIQETRRLGKTTVDLPTVGIGGVPIGELYRKVPSQQARDTLNSAWDAGIRYYDTSPWYGRGLSELRFGDVLRDRVRDDFVLSTKVGRTFHRPSNPREFIGDFWKGGLPFRHRFDYSYDGIMRSYEQSLMRLGINTIDLLLIHDLDVAEIGSVDLVDRGFQELEDGGWRALEILKHYGDIKGIGAGVNIMGTIPMFLERFDMDFFMVAMPYTLVDQAPLDHEFPLCEERSVGIIIGSPYASGILATGAYVDSPWYNYEPAKPDVIKKVQKIEDVCKEFGVSLKSAAYQFVLRHPIVASVVSGAARPDQAIQNAEAVREEIPDEFWAKIHDDGLVHPDAP